MLYQDCSEQIGAVMKSEYSRKLKSYPTPESLGLTAEELGSLKLRVYQFCHRHRPKWEQALADKERVQWRSYEQISSGTTTGICESQMLLSLLKLEPLASKGYFHFDFAIELTNFAGHSRGVSEKAWDEHF